MTDNITRTGRADADAMFIEREGRERAWHKLGTTFPTDQPMTVRQAYAASGIARIHYSMAPIAGLYANPVTGQRQLIKRAGESAHCYLVCDPIQGVREDPVILGDPVDASYTIVQPDDLARVLDPLAAKWKLETAGALGDGETIFTCFNAGGFDVPGLPGTNAKDELESYFVVANWTDGRHGLRAFFGPVRVVCQNTLTLGIASANAGIRLLHNGRIHDDLEWYTRLVGELAVTQARTVELFSKLAAHKGTEADAKAIIKSGFPDRRPTSKHQLAASLTADAFDAMPLLPGQSAGNGHSEPSKAEVAALMEQFKSQQDAIEAYNERQEARRAHTFTLFEREREAFPDHGVPWLALQAVVEQADFAGSARMTDQALAADATFDGTRLEIKHRAAVKALAIAGVEAR